MCDLGVDDVRACGLEEGINTTTKFDFMLDTLGGSAYGDMLKLMKRNSKIATIISERDAIKPSSVKKQEGELQLKIEFLFTRRDGENMNRIRELVEVQKLKLVVTEVYPLTVEGVKKAG